ncbi:MAG: hypothetical protein ACLGIG_03665 [Actinomycetes bacterium]
MRKVLALGTAAASLAGVVALASPANAEDTVATFTLTGNATGLAISVPTGTTESPISLGSAATGATTVGGQLGNVVVTDTRGLLAAAWTATATSTDFTTGTATANETVPTTRIAYNSGAGTAADGQVGTMTPGVSPALTAPALSVWAGVGNNTVTFNPTLTFTLLPSQVAGTYRGTVTHSVA